MATPSKSRSLVRWLSIRAVLWAALLGLTLGSVASWQYWRVSLRTIDARLEDEARSLATQITVGEETLNIDIPDELAGILEADDGYYGVFDAEGRLLDGMAPAGPAPGARLPLVRLRERHREALVNGPRGASVVVGRSLAPLYGEVRRLAASLLVASLVVAIFALPLAVWLRQQLARSIGQIDRTARLLAPGQPARIDAGAVDAEFVGVATALNDTFDRLERALARERQLTSDASHELRTPVTTLVAETQWALGRSRTSDEYRRSLEVCARQARRMKDLAESLLTLARLESGTLAPACEPVELRDLADETVAELLPLAAERDITVQVDGTAALQGDPVQLRTLVSNLVSNAVRYNWPHGQVHVRLSQAPDKVGLEVANTGSGIDPAETMRVFDRFWRADAARAARDGGTGLGLAISRAIVDAHGGTITCRSALNEGATFSVELPTTAGTGRAGLPPSRFALRRDSP
jgi:two-component system OmpR family sensor kinase